MGLHVLLKQPLKVFAFCFVFAFGSVLLNGALTNLYGLQRDREALTNQMVKIEADIKHLDGKLKRAKDPAFIERQALDSLDMASDHDLVFVFSE
ncbi:MAG: septum formation initiator family protein [Bdellovibrio sp.]|jgi:cell division protein FtsB